MIRKFFNALKVFIFPPKKKEEDFVEYVRTENGGMRLEYSSQEALYKRFKRQFDAATELAELQRQGKLK